jgi:hypothetical protein
VTVDRISSDEVSGFVANIFEYLSKLIALMKVAQTIMVIIGIEVLSTLSIRIENFSPFSSVRARKFRDSALKVRLRLQFNPDVAPLDTLPPPPPSNSAPWNSVNSDGLLYEGYFEVPPPSLCHHKLRRTNGGAISGLLVLVLYVP